HAMNSNLINQSNKMLRWFYNVFVSFLPENEPHYNEFAAHIRLSTGQFRILYRDEENSTDIEEYAANREPESVLLRLSNPENLTIRLRFSSVAMKSEFIELAFVNSHIVSGYHSLPSERDYWSESEDLGVQLVKDAISCNVYLEIKSILHFQDNSTANANKHDKTFELKPLIDMINGNLRDGAFSKKIYQ
ncbi:hypothetical protein ILUMI_19795, partial [Ignelater luminosus]